MALGVQPGTAQHQYVHPTVVVVIALDHVEAAHFADEPGLLGALGEGAVAVVVKEPQLIVQAPSRHHNVEKSVVIEILHDHAAREAFDVEADLGRDIGKSFDVVVRRKELWVDQPLGRHLFRIFAERHVGNVQQPARAEIAGKFPEQLCEQRQSPHASHAAGYALLLPVSGKRHESAL